MSDVTAGKPSLPLLLLSLLLYTWFFSLNATNGPAPEASRRVFGLLDTQLTESQPTRVAVRAESRLKAQGSSRKLVEGTPPRWFQQHPAPGPIGRPGRVALGTDTQCLSKPSPDFLTSPVFRPCIATIFPIKCKENIESFFSNIGTI